MSRLRPILIAGTIAGALDIVYAFIVYGPLSYHLSPIAVLQSVASGWLGEDAANAGGATTALLGLVTHITIAILMAAVFVVAAKGVPTVGRNPVFWGLIYGVGLYLVMTYLVLPLSAAHQSQHFATDLHEVVARLLVSFSAIRPRNRWLLLGTLFTHMVLVGVPIAVINRRHSRWRPKCSAAIPARMS
jgi:uncharacterized membrane protein YagU involved in acid resistance